MDIIQKRSTLLANQKGQSLVEYLILTSLLAVATLGVVRLMGHSVAAKFAQVTTAIQGRKQSVQIESVASGDYQKRDMSDFMNGASKRETNRNAERE